MIIRTRGSDTRPEREQNVGDFVFKLLHVISFTFCKWSILIAPPLRKFESGICRTTIIVKVIVDDDGDFADVDSD